MADCIPLFRPGGDITVLTTAAVTGKTFVGVSAARDTATGLIKAAPATAAGPALGVAARDAASGARGAVIAGPGTILFVTAGGTIAAGAQVEVGSAGKAVTLASGIAVGLALEAGTSGNDLLIKLY